MSMASPNVPSSQPASLAPLRLRQLTDVIGVEVLDIDLSQPLDSAAAAAVETAWHDNNILLFRNQSFTNT